MTADATNLAILAHDSALVMAVAEHMNGRLVRCHSDDIARTHGQTFAAAGALLPTDDGQAIRGHFNGAERTCLLAGTETETAAGAGFRAVGNLLCRSTIFQAQVTILELGLLVITLANDHGDLPCRSGSIDTENTRHPGNDITALLTDIESVRIAAGALLPLVIALPVVSVWCFLFDGVYIGATAAASMMVTMGIAFVIYLLVLEPMTARWGLHGLWGAVLVFMAARGLAQAAWYPALESRFNR